MFLFYLLPFPPSPVTTSKCGNNVEKNILITGLLGGKPTEKGGKKRVREIAIILCGSFFGIGLIYTQKKYSRLDTEQSLNTIHSTDTHIHSDLFWTCFIYVNIVFLVVFFLILSTLQIGYFLGGGI